MSDSTNLSLPYILPGQAQKHVTVNESLRRLDAIVQLSVVSATTTAQPASPSDGAVYIVPSGKSGAQWSAFADWSLGYHRDGAWEQIAPREGWLAWVRDTNLLLHWTGAAWSLFAPGALMTVSATDRLLGRAAAGAGAAEEIVCTAAGRALIDDASASAQRTTLGLGTAATQNTGTSGAAVPLLNGANTFGATQTLPAATITGTGMALTFSGVTAGSQQGSRFLNSSGVQQYAVGYNDSSGALFVNRYNPATGAYVDTPLSVSTGAGGQVAIGSTGDVLFGGVARPVNDNAISLGKSGNRWSVVYAGTGTINTSDAREKSQLRAFNDAERRAIRRVMAGVGVYQWLSAVETKGVAARLHVGVTAQDVAAAFETEGLDPGCYALWCEDDGPEPGERRLGLRYDQLILMALHCAIT